MKLTPVDNIKNFDRIIYATLGTLLLSFNSVYLDRAINYAKKVL